MAEKRKEKKKGLTIKVPNVNPWMVSTVILIGVLTFVLVGGWTITGQAVEPDGTTGILKPEEAANKAIDWISSYYKGQGADIEITLINASETENGIYQFVAKLSSPEGEVEQTLFVTRDGELFLPQIIETGEIIPEQEEEQSQTSDVPKSDKPNVNAFVMSYCPYGLQFMKAYIPVIELLEEKANLDLNFVHYIMHGEKEATENTRMYCIQKEQKDKFTDYLRCFVESGEAETCISDTGIDAISLESCIEQADEEFKITETLENSEDSYPPYLVDAALAQQYGVRGSPTFVINGQTISVNRSPEAIKQAVCSAFNNPPDECDQKLSNTAEQPGLGPIGSGSGASSSGQC